MTQGQGGQETGPMPTASAAGEYAPLLEGFASRLTSLLSQVANLPFRVRLQKLNAMPLGGFLRCLEDRSRCWWLGTGCAAGPVGLELDSEFAFGALERLLGGAGPQGGPAPSRPLTPLERLLLRRVAQAAGKALAEAGGGSETLVLEPSDEELPWPADPPEAPALCVTFSANADGQAGTLRLCLPATLAAELLARKTEAGADGAAGDPSASVKVSVTVEGPGVPPEELRGLAAGDIVTTDLPAGDEATVRVAGLAAFTARLGASNGRKAVTLTGKADPSPAPS